MLTLWVLAPPGDPARARLATLPADVRVVAGARRDDFEGAPAPDILLVCSLGRAALEPMWDLAGRARWVHARSAGVDSLLFPAFAESPAPLTNGRGVFSPALAEFVMAAVLYFAKDVPRLLSAQARGVWDEHETELVAGKTLAIVGYGDIGRAVAERARAFGMRVTALRRRPGQSAGDPLVDEVRPLGDRDALLAEADYVVVAAPLTPETRGLLGEAQIAALKPTAVLVNVGRGAVVDEGALVHALESRRIRGAALDVFETEPLPGGHPFYRLDNVLLSPHSADNVRGWRVDALAPFFENLERFRRGEPLRSLVDKRRGY